MLPSQRPFTPKLLSLSQDNSNKNFDKNFNNSLIRNSLDIKSKPLQTCNNSDPCKRCYYAMKSINMISKFRPM